MPLLWKFIICVNNNPKLQTFFKKSDIASKKALFIVVNSSILDLVEFLDLSLLNYI